MKTAREYAENLVSSAKSWGTEFTPSIALQAIPLEELVKCVEILRELSKYESAAKSAASWDGLRSVDENFSKAKEALAELERKAAKLTPPKA